ncbi:sugar transferase [Paradevosia shaoguanensis]|uniref:Sugar transferase n=1 Tax=Paradevosia shaoguanensis TaxID=1335043 RepID=A0AA41QIS4_9HYPH|nr:sugar transferase [Paradevosia shaoguanensis]MCF1740890.1 sugar transferase [Paradevosia shaoguanensis]MCI0125374.1 sugar transferase [Paradevosia shaoguanensis]
MSVDKTSFSKIPLYEDEDGSVGPVRRGLYPLVKRSMDIAGGLTLGAVALPIVLVAAALVRRDGGPAFYHQKRLGRNGEVFEIWKLRSMVMDADAHLARYLEENPEARREWDLHQKLKFDPRITPVGRFLRKYSIDELPQLWNVLKGDMSLVGPRPMFPSQRQIYPGSACFALRPGITGLWQTSARNASTFSERADYDLRYAREMSLTADIAILLRTVGIVLKGTGY